MMDQVQQASITTPLSLQQRVTAALCALMLGSFLVFGRRHGQLRYTPQCSTRRPARFRISLPLISI